MQWSDGAGDGARNNTGLPVREVAIGNGAAVILCWMGLDNMTVRTTGEYYGHGLHQALRGVHTG